MGETLTRYTELLESQYASERLYAARYFADCGTLSELQALRVALAKENVTWIENALRRAIFRLEPDGSNLEPSQIPGPSSDLVENFPDQMFAEALETTTKQVLHEIEPLIGGLRLAAAREIDNFESSKTCEKLDRLSRFMAALSRLREAASSPEMQEFHLDGVALDCIAAVREETMEERIPPVLFKILEVGKRPCVAYGDPGLLSLALRNGIKNAVESIMALGDGGKHDVIVSWGETEKNYWVSVLDDGVGFIGNTLKVFEMGKTTKSDHLGMGLTISKRAIASLGGDITLTPRERGVRFELSWPKRL
jgi:signal transduction histidine kinase